MPEIVKIPIAIFEVEMEYTGPDLKMWLDRANVVQAVYKALQPWGLKVDDVEILTTGKPSEQGIRFKIPQRTASFFFGPANCRFTRDNTSWETAEETIQILDAAVSALLSQTEAQVASRKTVVALHIQLTSTPFRQVLAPLISPALRSLQPGEPTTAASIVAWENRKITVDGSAQLANGIFVRLERDFDGQTAYDDIARQLFADEKRLFALLGIEEER